MEWKTSFKDAYEISLQKKELWVETITMIYVILH